MWRFLIRNADVIDLNTLLAAFDVKLKENNYSLQREFFIQCTIILNASVIYFLLCNKTKTNYRIKTLKRCSFVT